MKIGNKQKIWVVILTITNILVWYAWLKPTETYQRFLIIGLLYLLMNFINGEKFETKKYANLAGILIVWDLLKAIFGSWFWIPLTIFFLWISYKAGTSEGMLGASDNFLKALKKVKIKDLTEEELKEDERNKKQQ